MKKLRKASHRWPALALILAGAPGFGATEFEDSIPIELARAVLGFGAFGNVGIYADILEEFPPLDIPEDFEVLGSVDRQLLQTVVLETELGLAQARESLAASFVQQGWEIQETPGANRPQTGFIATPSVVTETIRLCHEEHASLQLGALEQDDDTIITLNRTVPPPGTFILDCEAQANMVMGPYGPGREYGVQQYMPRLEMPASTGSFGGSFLAGGGGGSQNDYESRTSLAVDWPLEEVYEHFAKQIDAQGWQGDARLVNDNLGTGSWRKSEEDDLQLLGILQVVKTAEQSFDLKFRILSQGQTRGGVGARIGGFDIP